MLKSITALLAAVVGALILLGSATGASANGRHHGCCGGPIPPSYVYSTAHRVSHVTRYHDVSRTNYVYRQHRIVHVTRVQPIVYVHVVTRVHHHTVGVIRPVHEHYTQYLPTRTYTTGSVVNTYDCLCRPHCRY